MNRAFWVEQKEKHRQRLEPSVSRWLDRRAKNIRHPVEDFLFEYYSFRPSHLLRWSPGTDCILEDCIAKDLDWQQFLPTDDGGLVLPASAYPKQRLGLIRWGLSYLQGIRDRTPFWACFGLHEWAMVYEEKKIRHESTPLRLSLSEVAEVIESSELICTHYDAYRFFTSPAIPRNRYTLTRDSSEQFDQPGCIHVNMDLYKYAYKLAPFSSGDLIADCFEVAWAARQIDMRASPYDLSSFGLDPILIETRTGREQYIREQKEISERAKPVREQLIDLYSRISIATQMEKENVLDVTD